MSLRARILLLVLFAMLAPVLALTFFFTIDREADVAEAQRRLSATAQRIAKDLEDVIRATAQIKQTSPETPVILLTGWG